MIRFRQKNYNAAAIMTGLNVLGLGATGAQMIQADQQGKEQEAQSKAMEEQMKRQNKALERIARNSAKNPRAAQQAAEVVSQKGFSSKGHYILKRFGVPATAVKNLFSWNNIKGLGKDLGNVVWNNKKTIAGWGTMGAGIAGGSYIANKAIQNDMEKHGIELPNNNQQKAYSAEGTLIGNSFKTGLGKIGGVASGLGFGAISPTMSYLSERQALIDQANQTRQTANNTNTPPKFRQKQYGMAMPLRSIAKGFRAFKRNPMQSILGTASSFSGTGGVKGYNSFANSLANSTNSELSQAAGNWLKNHKTLGLAGTTVIGGSALGSVYSAGDKAVRGTANALDPNAFAYENSKQQQIQ